MRIAFFLTGTSDCVLIIVITKKEFLKNPFAVNFFSAKPENLKFGGQFYTIHFFQRLCTKTIYRLHRVNRKFYYIFSARSAIRLSLFLRYAPCVATLRMPNLSCCKMFRRTLLCRRRRSFPKSWWTDI